MRPRVALSFEPFFPEAADDDGTAGPLVVGAFDCQAIRV